MSKRRNRNKSPNLPEATLRRAREQLEGEDEDSTEETETQEEPRHRSRRERRTSRRSAQPDTVQYSRRRDKDSLDHEAIEEMLAHPTKFVSEEELRAEYSYVLADIRNMAILAGALFVVLIILAQFI